MTKEAFEAGIIAMQDTLYRVSATMLRQMCDREDAIQACILKALTHRQKLRDDAALKSWVIRILVNECYQLMRKGSRERPTDVLPEPEPEPRQEQETDVFLALNSLDLNLRLPIVLYYVEGYPLKDISRMLRIPQGTVKSRMARARRLMRAALNQMEGEATLK